jgi:hypothetical protein
MIVRFLAAGGSVLGCGAPPGRREGARPYPRSAKAPLRLQPKLLLPEFPALL